ncbi:MAG: dihydroorotate dehydrogenase electron transfer subunit, partial [Candidatus Omnitrophota bacterium]
APDHFTMELEAPFLAQNSAPGQFVTVKTQEKGASDPLFRIPLGVHAVRKSGIKLLYKVVGTATGMLSAKAKGETLDVLGPLGNGFDLAPVLRNKDSRAVLVAGGHGVAPLYFLAKTLARKKRKIDVFIGACEAKHIVCAKEFRKLKAKVTTAAEKGRCQCQGYVTKPLSEYLRRNRKHAQKMTIYACGPRPMLAALAEEAKKYQVPAQGSLDAYMVCGIGACLGCAVETTDGYKLVCKDGPVFNVQEIKWKKAC